MSPSRIAIAAVALAACPAFAAEDNKVTIENKIAQCQGCHGIADWKTAFPEVYEVPKLGGIRIRCTHPDRVVGAGGCATGWTAAAS